jgi:hypothetical protein
MNTTHNTQFIIRKLGFTHLEYCEMVEHSGYVWLDKYFFHSPEIIQASSYSQLFWKWWVNEWNIRDDQFIRHVRFCHPEVEQLSFYLDIHSIRKLEIRPNRFAITEVNKILKQQILASL